MRNIDEIERLRAALWQCFADAGGDTDGDANADAISTEYLIRMATGCVKDIRECYDELLDESNEADRLRARVAELEAERAPRVDVDAISDERIQSGSEAYFAECSRLEVTGEQSADIYMRCMRAALRAIFNTKDK